MIVFKFGGASVKDAASVRNVAEVIRHHLSQPMIAVVSAMGKTTNAIEEYLKLSRSDDADADKTLQRITDYHLGIVNELFSGISQEIRTELINLINEMKSSASALKAEPYDFCYDQIVSYGELLSSKILSHYLHHAGLQHQLLDARELIITMPPHREATVDWERTQKNICRAISTNKEGLWLTQGFIAGMNKATSTLGREGSDFSAAILAWACEADSLTIWKDVPGLLNADPKYFSRTRMLEHISYKEAIELAYYGATIIHPKTIKPLQNKEIPLRIRSFLDYTKEGSLVDQHSDADSRIPSYIFKHRQTLISISPRDFSFIVEENLSFIFSRLADLHIKANLMQNSAISFSICIDGDEKSDLLIRELQGLYKVSYNTDLQLITIRHYTDILINELVGGQKIMLEQRSRSTCQLVVKPS